MIIKGILIDPKDQAVTVTGEAAPGDTVIIRQDQDTEKIEIKEKIPKYHKAARSDIKKGDYVYKYGQKIGIAVSDIEKGTWIHTHNLKSESMV